jgi:amino acid adenylation domain-containing protein
MNTEQQLKRIEAKLRGLSHTPATAGVAPESPPVPEPIAIVGMAGYFPGCMSKEEFWKALEENRSLLEVIPRDRFDWESMYDSTNNDPNKSCTKWGGFIPDIRGFDPGFFNISERDAGRIDPRQRLLLMSVYHTLEDAGYAPQSMRKSRTGVFVAVEDDEYLELLRRKFGNSGDGIDDSAPMVANRISHFFDFRGPSEFINTLCSGGAVALHRAIQSLRAGEITGAIVSAANLLLLPDTFIKLSRLDQLSSDGSVHSFGKDAQGHVRSEAVASLLLKPLSQAEADGDLIYAIIKNTAVNHNGRGASSLASPDPNVQSDLIRRCCELVNLDPTRLAYIEAQGMGNPLSDIAEWRAFNSALNGLAESKGLVLKPKRCRVGTIKPLAGHMEAASSLGALFKVIHSLRTRTIFGIHGFSEMNPELNGEGQPCEVAVRSTAWPDDGLPGVAGLHAHGIGGNNAHVLVEEYASPSGRSNRRSATYIAVLSAPTVAKLAHLARNLLGWLEKRPELAIEDIAFTLQVGRDVMDSRMAVVAKDRAELALGLGSYLNGEKSRHVFSASMIERKVGLGSPNLHDPQAVARFWVSGGTVPWQDLYGGRTPRRVSLPPYVFECKPYWLDDENVNSPEIDSAKSIREQIQELLILMIGEELKLSPSSIDCRKHFMAFGLDSLANLRLAQRLSRSFGVSVRLRQLMEYSSIETFSEFLASRVAGHKTEEVVLVGQPASNTSSAAPLSECQRGLWALQKMHPELTAYNVPLCLRVFRKLDIEMLRKACQFLVKQHPSLSCGIKEERGALFHTPAESPIILEESNFEKASDDAIDTHLLRQLKAPFDLKTGPLIRFHLVHSSKAESILLIAMHHLVVDGLSAIPLLQTLLDAYLAISKGLAPKPSAVSSSFGGFVEWQQMQLAGESGKRLESYWRAQLSGDLPALNLITDSPRSNTILSEGQIVTVSIEKEFASELRSFVRNQRVSLATLFLGLYKTLLHRYSGDSEIVVGVPTQLRPAGFEGHVGYFINMLPIRTRGLADLTFKGLLQSLQRTMADGMDHAAYPFPRMVKALGLTGGENANPLFQVAFEYQSFLDPDAFESRYKEDFPFELLERPRQTGEYELVLEVVERAGGFDLNFKYDAALFGTATIQRMAKHFVALTQDVVVDPNSSLRSYRMLSKGELEQIRSEWNNTKKEYSRDRCVHDLIEARAQEAPHAIAFQIADRSMTYGELDRRSTVFALYLQALGVKADDLVAICVDRSLDMMVVLLGILKTGGAYVPLDPIYPAERLTFMLRDSHAAVIVAQTHLRGKVAELVSNSQNGRQRIIVEVDGNWAEIERVAGDQGPLERKSAPHNLAYVIYTSGSTGTPKGVMIPHRALTNFLMSMAREPGLRREDRLLAVTTLSFDIAGLELFLPLVQGAQCYLCAPDESNDVTRLKALISQWRPTIMQATPSTWRMLLHGGWHNEERVKILCGGEALPEDVAQGFIDRRMEAWNMYGPTETTIWSTLQRIEENVPIGIGRPIANTRVYVLDRFGNLVPVGVSGELFIAGDGLATGYLNRPQLSAEKFVEVPSVPGERLYKTGDLVCWRDDGTIKYLGRADHQVKIRGHRIELEEVESWLNRMSAIEKAAVIVREHQGSKQLVGYYVPSGGGAASRDFNLEKEFSSQLKAHLPDYMIPAFFIALGELPLTPNGKIDRKNLADRKIEVQKLAKASRNTSELEKSVIQIWQEVLGVENIGSTDGFFEAGGDSVLAVILAERISTFFGIRFTTIDLFRLTTVGAICSELAGQHQTKLFASEPRMRPLAAAPKEFEASGTQPEYLQDSLAIIGMSCQFPSAETHQAFWANLRAGVESGIYFSKDELRAAGVPEYLVSDPAFVPVQMTIDGKDLFDPDFFNIPAKNASLMDPQCRLLLMQSWKAIEDAGYIPSDISDCGVFMSVSNTFYSTPAIDAESDLYEGDNYVAWLMAQEGTVATMISYQLGLRGPSYAVHANCSSSLVGLHAAFQCLRSDETKYALIGAASLLPSTRVGYLYQEGMNFSTDGRCKTFDASASGLVGGEGVGVLLVKKASQAIADGDLIYALVRGVALNNDGSNKAGFYAPGFTGQSEVIEKVLSSTGIHPDSISYVEAHGTGTKLGDPVEVAALTSAYRKQTNRKRFCGIGSVKSNIGHLDTAAGLAGCIKVALSLKHRELPPTLHYKTPNPEIDFDNSPFYVVDQLREWPGGAGSRRAGLTSLGIGGTNAHAILEEWPATQADSGALAGSYLFVFSGKDEERLREVIEKFQIFLQENFGSIQLPDVAFTLQVGRVGMANRAAFVAGTAEELKTQLASFLVGETAHTSFWAATVSSNGEGFDFLRDDDATLQLTKRWFAEGNLAKLAQLWVRGLVVDWKSLYTNQFPKRISLPTYPFARESYRLVKKAPGSRRAVIDAAPAATLLHPLLHENISTLEEHRYRSFFTGAESFLSGHVVQGRRILPGVAYLEMAHAALMSSFEAPARVSLKHIAWVRPFEVDSEARQLQVALKKESEGTIRFEISTLGELEKGERVLLCQGVAIRSEETSIRAQVNRVFAPAKDALRFDAETCYNEFKRLGFDYGPGQRGLVEIFVTANHVLARLSLPHSVASTVNQYTLHPSLLDSAVQASIGLYLHDRNLNALTEGPVLLPFALEKLEVFDGCVAEMWATVTRVAFNEGRFDSEMLNIDLFDLEGRIRVRIKGFFSRKVSSQETLHVSESVETWMSGWSWKPVVQVSQGAEHQFRKKYFFVCDLNLAVTDLLQHSGEAIEWVEIKSRQTSAEKRFEEIADSVFQKLKTILAGKPTQDLLIQVVVPLQDEGAGLQGISGLLRSASLENPQIFAQLIDVDGDIAADELTRNLRQCSQRPDLVRTRYRNGLWETQKRTEVEGVTGNPENPWRGGGNYLITGGAGGLGVIFAEEIGRHAKDARVILVGRSELNPRQETKLKNLGIRYDYRRADVSKREEVDLLLAWIRTEIGPLHGVLHAAGIIRDNFILRKSSDEFKSVLESKVAGTIHLDCAIGGDDLDFFVGFSSIAGAFGSASQSDYASANAFLAEFAEYRQNLVVSGARRGRSLAIDWPLWSEGGMRMDLVSEREMIEMTGFVPMSTAQGIKAFYQALRSDVSRVTVMNGNRKKILDYLDTTNRRLPQNHLSPRPLNGVSTGFEASALEFLRGEIASVLERPVHRVKDGEKFERYGVDSIMAVQLTNRLEKKFGSLPKTLFFEYQTLKELGGYFIESHADKLRLMDGAYSGVKPPLQAPRLPSERIEPTFSVARADKRVETSDVAIISISARFPQARDFAEFWDILREGRDCITEIPPERWDWRKHYSEDRKRVGTHSSKWGGFIDEVDKFDPLFFNISPREAELVDPQERLFLETVWNLLEGVGYTREQMRTRYQSRVAVYLGAMYQQYHAFQSDLVSESVVSLSSFSGIPNRVSYFFDFQGPSVAVDTMCSSSIVAIQMACESLRSGESMLAIAGGVNLSIHPKKYLGLSAAKLMGSSPKSRSFADGDGYLPAEGVGAVLLKPLARAIEDGDPIFAVIKSVTTNHSGQSGGFAVPNPKAQAQAVEDCLRRSGVDPRTISYIESAANGSPLGDSIEIKALTNVFANYFQKPGLLGIGAVKSNIGHAEAASGMAQLAKVILQMQHRQLAPTVLAGPLNPNIDFSSTPFHLEKELREWKRPVLQVDGQKREFPRRAIIHSVGAGGSTAHLVLEEYEDDRPVDTSEIPDNEPALILLSARTEERLKVLVQNIRKYVAETPHCRLCDLAYTLQMGREAMDARAALVVTSHQALLRGLGALEERLNGNVKADSKIPIFTGNAEDGNPAIRELLSGPTGEIILRELFASHELEKLALYWAAGEELSWAELYKGRRARMLHLPTYPFERRRCWLQDNRSDTPLLLAEAVEDNNAEPVSREGKVFSDSLRLHIGKLLGIDPHELSAKKSLNSLGFSSLDAVNLKSKLEQEFAVEIPIVSLNAYQSIERIEAEIGHLFGTAVKSAESNGSDPLPRALYPIIVLNPQDRFRPFPLSDIQESFFLGRKMAATGEQTGCHIYFEITVGELDIYRLNHAWNRLIKHHEMLRAVILPDGTQQIIEETAPYRFKTFDLRRRTALEQSAHLERIREKMSHRIYDPGQWPLFEIRVDLLSERQIIHFSIDELIIDASGIELLFQQWQRLYLNPEDELPKLSLSFRDYILASRKFADSERYARDMDYWMGRLAEMPGGPELPSSDGAAEKHHCVRLEGTLNTADWAALKQKAESFHSSPTALLLCLFVEALRQHSDSKTFSLILTFFNRMPIHPEVDQILGPFISTNIFVAEEVADTSLVGKLEETQKLLWQDLDHSSVSGIRVLRELRRLRKVSNSLSLPVVFTSMLGNRMAVQESLLKNVSYSVTQTPQVYLDHQLYEQNGELRFSWDMVEGRFESGAIQALFETYCAILKLLATKPEVWQGEEWVTKLHSLESPGKSVLQAHPEEYGKPFALTDQQQAYAFGRSAFGSSTASNVYMAFEAESLDVPRLEAAWQQVIRAHPMLATTIQSDGLQRSLPEIPVYIIEVNDFRSHSEQSLEGALKEVETAMMARICPLGEWPFFELRVSRIDSVKWCVHFCIDMIIADGASIDLLAQELFNFYGKANTQAAPRIAFQDYVLYLKQQERTESFSKSIEYWSRKFATIPSGPNLIRLDAVAGGETYRLSANLAGWDQLKAKADEFSIAPSMVLLTVFAEVLWAWSDHQPFTLAVPCWERPDLHPDINRVVGDFTAMCWVVVTRGAETFREKAIWNHAELQADLAHGVSGSLRVLRKLALRNGNRDRFIFPMVFTNLSTQPPLQLPDGIQFGKSLSQTSHVHLDNMSSELGGNLGIYWDVAEGLFPPGMIEEMFEDYHRLLTSLVAESALWDARDFSSLIGGGREKYLKQPLVENSDLAGSL